MLEKPDRLAAYRRFLFANTSTTNSLLHATGVWGLESSLRES